MHNTEDARDSGGTKFEGTDELVKRGFDIARNALRRYVV